MPHAQCLMPIAASNKRTGHSLKDKPVVQRYQQDGQEEVENQYNDKGRHERFGGGSTNTFGAGLTVQATMAANKGNRYAEEKRLDHAHADIPHGHEIFGMGPVVVGLDAEQPRTDECPSHYTHEVGHHCQEGNEQATGQESGDDEVMQGMGAEAGKRVN